MMPASRGVAVAYSVMLQTTHAPMHEAHRAFVDTYDQPPATARELTDAEKREVLRAQMRAAGTDASSRALAGKLP